MLFTRWIYFLLVFVIVLLDYVNGEENVGGVVRKRMGHKRKQVSCLYLGSYGMMNEMRKCFEFVFSGVGVAENPIDLFVSRRI